MPFRRRYRRRRFRRSSRRSSRYRSPWSALRRVRRRRPRYSLTRRAVLSNRRSIQNIRREIEVKDSHQAQFPNSSGDIPPVNSNAAGPANGLSGINSGLLPLTVGRTGQLETGPHANMYFCPGLISTKVGIGETNVPGGGGLIGVGARIGQYVTMKSLCVKLQLKLRRDFGQNAPVRVHLFLVLDKDPQSRWNPAPGAAGNDVNFSISDKKFSCMPAAAINGLVDNPIRMQYTFPRDTQVQQRFKVLRKTTVSLSRGSAASIPMAVTGPPPFISNGDSPIPGVQSALETGNVATSSLTAVPAGPVSDATSLAATDQEVVPMHGQGQSSAPFVKYVTMFMKGNYKFDFGPVRPYTAGNQRYELPTNHTIRLMAYTETTGVSVTDDINSQADQALVDIIYSGRFRYTDA